ncbi:uncharacterized protein LOC117341494 [Pecten maximus]|uniref:uncharacterized protein LOC117341494 n=1 Tax=Pecten maximus TaxID=6579 RepID=UPI0014584EFA|nr:uncharacterized protein LOC117341494 [Pecten maximus]
MYEQCLPDNSLDLAISSVATHYLSKQVCQIKNGVFMGEADVQEQALMREQGKTDWRKFVISRGRELKPGGVLITMNVSLDKDNNTPTLIDKGLGYLGSFVSEMAKEGVITQEEYLSTTYHIHYMRTPADFEEPFINDVPEIEELGLELVSVKTIKQHLQHPLFDTANKGNGERLDYSRRIVAMVYPWFHHVLYMGLSLSRTEEEKEMVIGQYFRRLQTYAFEHSDNKPYVTMTEVVFKKR